MFKKLVTVCDSAGMTNFIVAGKSAVGSVSDKLIT